MSEFIKTGVIGHPIAHSKSPLIHSHWIEKYGLSGSYEALDVPPENLESALKSLLEAGYQGFNITIPHKEMVLDFCDEIDDLAQQVGAVNTITMSNGQIVGSNTDVFGFVENIKTQQPEFDFTAGPALVLGAGGAARAIVYGLLAEGAPEIILVNRSGARAEELKADCLDPSRVKIMDWESHDSVLDHINFLVNTTALGMTGQPHLLLDITGLNTTALVHDVVYTPLHTDLLQQARAGGNPVVTGIGMLLQQARPAFEKWFGVMPEIDEELENLVLNGLGAA